MKKILLLATILLIQTVCAQNIYEFLRINSSPRAEALAGSYNTNTDDPNVIFYNPAGIFHLKETPVAFSYLNYLADISMYNISMSKEIDGVGRFGAGLQYINYGDFTKADENGNKLGNFSAGDLALLIGYSLEIETNLYLGANAKFIYSSIDEYSSTAVAADLGLQYVLPESKWVFAVSVSNLGTQLSKYFDISEDLPVDIQIGISKELEHLPFKFYLAVNRLADDADSFGDRFKNITAGGEMKLGKSFRLRIGYDSQIRKDYKIGTTSGLAGFNFGAGFAVKSYNFDYAFSSLGSIDGLHRIGISTKF